MKSLGNLSKGWRRVSMDLLRLCRKKLMVGFGVFFVILIFELVRDVLQDSIYAACYSAEAILTI